MIKLDQRHKRNAIISSIVILLPILVGAILWNTLPDSIATHWGADGIADGFSGKGFAVFGIPCILLVLHWLCLLITAADARNKGQTQKAIGMLFWIIPCLSLFVNAIMYSVALGKELGLELLIPALLGLSFVALGNYLPKVKQNRTLGIKIRWTLQNEENWNLTHRMAGKLWVAGGVLILFSAFLPLAAASVAMVVIVLALCVIPMLYSYRIYQKHTAQGVEYTSLPASRSETIILWVAGVVAVCILAGAAVLLFTGSIRYEYTEESLQIEASYWGDLTLDYAAIDHMEYRQECPAGVRSFGFGSPRLSLGKFENEEFGPYTRYTYTGCASCIVLESDGNILVLSGSDEAQTKAIYDTLLTKI